MTSSWFNRKGALSALLHDGFWKSDHDFLIVFHINFLSDLHGFRDKVVLFQAGCDVIVISPPGGAACKFLNADSERATPITCSAIALSTVWMTALVLYGNMKTSTPHSSETSQDVTTTFFMFDYVLETNTCTKLAWNSPARGSSTHTWNIHFLWLFFRPAFLPSFSCAPAQAKGIHIISRTMAQKTQFEARKCPPSSSFIWRFGGHFPQNPQNFASVGESQSYTKSRITSKPLKIDKKCQLNMNITSGSPFQNPAEVSRWRHIRLAIKPHYLGNHASQMKGYYGALWGNHGRFFRIRHVK